jgi:hypothetical protein
LGLDLEWSQSRSSLLKTEQKELSKIAYDFLDPPVAHDRNLHRPISFEVCGFSRLLILQLI